jgi:VIT1/CCC1 family predicted Fe2+/Mn2+ transporter
MNELIELVTKFSPILASLLSISNPFAGVIVSAIAGKFNANRDNLQDIISKIKCDENADKKLQEIQMLHANSIANIYLADKDSAREREEKITKTLKKRDYVMEGIAVAVVVGYFAMCCLTVFYSIPLADHDMLNMLFGQLMGGFMMVLSYYFGSSNK